MKRADAIAARRAEAMPTPLVTIRITRERLDVYLNESPPAVQADTHAMIAAGMLIVETPEGTETGVEIP